jgi:predicted CxxxxCH...CXXCH cytochrome family protein
MHQKARQIKRSSYVLGMLALLLPLIALTLPKEAASATISCSNGLSGCHFNTKVKDGTARNTPAGLFLGTHARHAGYSTSSAKREYQYACTKCHPSASYTNAHQSGFKNITGSSLPGNRYSMGKKLANTNTPTFGNCSNIYCHSNGRATGMGQVQYSSSRWGGTEGCLGCHGGRTSATGTYARSVGNFTLSTTHSQHLKYPAANMNCQMCHSKTAMTDAWTLKSYTAATRHNNGKRDVTFTDVNYGSYTSYKSTEAGSAGNTKTCNNVSCHGGKSRSSWSATTINTNNTCVHCHGVDGSATLRADKYNAAPGWGGTGTSTDQVAVNTDKRVGAHFVHLSSVYMAKLKCNECHSVPTTPFTGTHMATPRYNSQTLTFAQASTATKNTTTPAKTDGTAAAAATCTTTYCHGGNMLKGDTSGSARSPQWDQATLMSGSPGADCGTCHGNPPASVSASHSGKTATTSCVQCHSMVVDATGKIINKSLHMNGSVNVTADCNGCHKYDVTGTNAWLNTTGTDLTHFKHITFIKNRIGYGALTVTNQTFGTGEPAAVCGTCHTNTLSAHNNGTKDVTFGAGGTTYTMGAGTANSMSLVFGGSNPVANIIVSGSNVTCSNLMCHYATTPNWY